MKKYAYYVLIATYAVLILAVICVPILLPKTLGFWWIVCFLLLLVLTVLNILILGAIAFSRKKYSRGALLLSPILLVMIGVFVLIPDLTKSHVQSSFESCRAQLRGVQSGLELYYTYFKYYPENIEVLIKEGYLQEKGDIDPWSTPYKYERTSDKSNYLIGSAGEDKLFDTKDDVEAPINTVAHTYKKNIEVKK